MRIENSFEITQYSFELIKQVGCLANSEQNIKVLFGKMTLEEAIAFIEENKSLEEIQITNRFMFNYSNEQESKTNRYKFMSNLFSKLPRLSDFKIQEIDKQRHESGLLNPMFIFENGYANINLGTEGCFEVHF